MSTYKEIKGRLIKTVTSDPTYATAGEMWYNKTIGVLKARTFVAATWTSGGALPNPRFDVTGAKQQVRTAALAIGGYSPATPGVGSPNTFEYNGSAWSGGGNLNTGRVNVATAGTQTAAVGSGGDNYSPSQQSATEHYNGSSWSNATSAPFSANRRSAAGTQTAAIYVGGFTAGPTGNTTTQADEYNGSSWTTVTAYPQSAQQIAGAGTQTAAIFIGGAQKPAPGSSTVRINNTVEYDGTNWTAGGNYPTNVSNIGTGGTQTDLLGFAGQETPTGSPPISYSKVTKSYDGSAWTSLSATLTTNGSQGDGSGSTTSGDSLIYGGYDGSATQKTTEEWDAGGTFNRIVTTS